MAKKIKKFSRNINSPRRGGEKLKRALRQFSIAVVLYIAVVIIAAIIGCCAGEYDLSKPTTGGFAVCFLLFPAYLPMLIIGGIAGMCGAAVNISSGNEIMILALCDIVIAANLWWIVRLAAFKRQSASLLRTTKRFVWIMVIWGWCQLGCSLIYFSHQKSRFNALHLHLSAPEAETGQP